ncbi:hypothetical protein [Leptolyngbya boryana]|uniref:hypothetical protein n=1 Tax=Leptolyngbya boryana TaxID=1184 RepID=UPI003D64B87D
MTDSITASLINLSPWEFPKITLFSRFIRPTFAHTSDTQLPDPIDTLSLAQQNRSTLISLVPNSTIAIALEKS